MGRLKYIARDMKDVALFIITLFFIGVLSVSAATPTTINQAFQQAATGQGAIPSTSPLFSTLFLHWKQIVLLLSLIVIFLMGFAYMAADFFGVPRLKSWALVEFGNVVMTFIIMLSMVAVLQFSDNLLRWYVNHDPSSPFHCSSKEMCTISVANQYLSKLVDLAEQTGRAAYVAGWQAMRSEIQGHTVSCSNFFIPVPCLAGYVTFRPNSYLLLDYERSMIEMRSATSIAESLIVQLFFSKYITYLVGPILLMLGVIARAFPGTRGLGGLLLASGFGVLFVFPAMYVWNAMSLNIAIYGTNLVSIKDNCPAICHTPPPIGYKVVKGQVVKAYEPSQVDASASRDQISRFLNGSLASLNGFTSCEYLAQHNSYGYCPFVCRVIPYPYYISDCSNIPTERACDHLTSYCSVIHDMPEAQCDRKAANDGCPASCVVKIPAPTNPASCDACLAAPAACRVALPLDPPNYPWRLRACVESMNASTASATVHCPAQCMYILGHAADAKCYGPFCCVGARCVFKYTQKINQKTTSIQITTNGAVLYAPLVSKQYSTPPSNSGSGTSSGSSSTGTLIAINVNIQGNVVNLLNYPTVTYKGTIYYNVTLPYTSSNPSTAYPYYVNSTPTTQNGKTVYQVRYTLVSSKQVTQNGVVSGIAYQCLNPAGKVVWGPTVGCSPGTCFTKNPDKNPVCAIYSKLSCGDVSTYPSSIVDNYFPYCTTHPATYPLYYNTSAECWDTQKWCKVVNGKCASTPACVPHGPQVQAPVQQCNNCSDVPQQCQFSHGSTPNIPFCQESCYTPNEGTSPDVLTPSEFLSKSREGMVGRKDIVDVASLYLPAYALPLLNILVTLVFIRSLAPFFGGDYYIPGWIKIM